jgi:hypothetical protein
MENLNGQAVVSEKTLTPADENLDFFYPAFFRWQISLKNPG